MFYVNIIEYSKGYGRTVVDIKAFSSESGALEFVSTFNAKNDGNTALNWLSYAVYLGKI